MEKWPNTPFKQQMSVHEETITLGVEGKDYGPEFLYSAELLFKCEATAGQGLIKSNIIFEKVSLQFI